MKYIFMLMFLFIILAPAIYFYYQNKHRRTLIPLTLFSVIVIGVRLIIKPDFIFWKWLTLIVQFYVLFVFAYFLCSLVATGIRYFTHKELSQKLPYVLMTIAICLTSLGFYTHYTKEVKSYDIYINKESTIDALKVAMLSDLHLGTGTYQEDVEKLVKTLNDKHYDVVLFCGDFFDETTPFSMIQPCLQELSNIQTTYGIYAIEGNHENYASINNEDIYENTNIHFLSNNYVCVNGLFNIIGRTDMISPVQKDMQDICKDIDTSLPTIVLDHNPKNPALLNMLKKLNTYISFYQGIHLDDWFNAKEKILFSIDKKIKQMTSNIPVILQIVINIDEKTKKTELSYQILESLVSLALTIIPDKETFEDIESEVVNKYFGDIYHQIQIKVK